MSALYRIAPNPDGTWRVYSAVSGEHAAAAETETKAIETATLLNSSAKHALDIVQAMLRPHVIGRA